MNKKNHDKETAKTIAEKYGLIQTLHWWPHKQSGKFILTHDAVQIIADAEGIVFDPPSVNWDELPNISLMIVGRLGEKFEWSFGEVNPKNSFNPYPWAMAEKRAKDRVTLKLIGAYKLGISSEVEAEAFSEKGKIELDEDDGSGISSPKQALKSQKKVEGSNDTETTTSDLVSKIKDMDQKFGVIKENVEKLEKCKTWFKKIGAEDDFNGILIKECQGMTKLDEVAEHFNVENLLKVLRTEYTQLKGSA